MRGLGVTTLLALLALLAGCNGLLDLDEAHLDPTIGAERTAGGSSGGSFSDAGAGSEGGAAGAAAASLCEEYCQAVTDGCTGDSTQYTNLKRASPAVPTFRRATRATRVVTRSTAG